MRTFNTPYVADWYAVSLRWLTLLGMVVSLSMGGILFSGAVWPLGGLVFWNMTMTMFAGLSSRMKYHRQVSLALDLLITGVFFWWQGGCGRGYCLLWSGRSTLNCGARSSLRVYSPFWKLSAFGPDRFSRPFCGHLSLLLPLLWGWDCCLDLSAVA